MVEEKPEPSKYKPMCKFSQFGIVFHFVLVPTKIKTRRTKQDSALVPDRNLDSIERDLLACNYRDDDARPFRSKVIKVEKPTISVQFPSNIVYEAEGRIIAHENRTPTKTCSLAAFLTVFKRNKPAVLSVALTSIGTEHDAFDEIDIISLAKLWEGGEGTGTKNHCLHCGIRFEIEPDSIPVAQGNVVDGVRAKLRQGLHRFLSRRHSLWGTNRHDTKLKLSPAHKHSNKTDRGISISDLAKHLFEAACRVGDGFADDLQPGTLNMRLVGGTIQIVDPRCRDAGGGNYRWDWKAFEPKIAAVHDPNRHIQVALKGMVTGLLDIGGNRNEPDDNERVDTQELADSLRRFDNMFYEQDAIEYAAANKATLLVFNSKCRLFNDYHEKVGVNPYLWLSHIVAIYNEEVLRLAVENFVEAEESQSESKFERAQASMREWLQSDRLLNVFHYDHEQTLYKRCFETRGVSDLNETADLRLKRVEGRVSELKDIRQRRTAYLLQVSIALVSVASILGNYSNIRNLLENAWDRYIWLGGGLIGVAVILAIMGFAISFVPNRIWSIPIVKLLAPLLFAVLMIALVFCALAAWTHFGPELPTVAGHNKPDPHQPAITHSRSQNDSKP